MGWEDNTVVGCPRAPLRGKRGARDEVTGTSSALCYRGVVSLTRASYVYPCFVSGGDVALWSCGEEAGPSGFCCQLLNLSVTLEGRLEHIPKQSFHPWRVRGTS